MLVILWFFFFKQKTAYEMRISDWSSDVCSSDRVRAPTLFIDGERSFGLTAVTADERAARRACFGERQERLIANAGHMLHFDAPLATAQAMATFLQQTRSEERRVGQECVSTLRSRWSPYHYKKKTVKTIES